MRIFLSTVVLFLSIKATCFAVPEIVQIILAEKWFTTVGKYSNGEKQEFVLGSLINNIHFLDDIMAQPSPTGAVTLNDVYMTSNPFEAGKKFFYYVYQKKQHIIDKWGIYRDLVGIEPEHYYHFLRLLEDELLFDPQICARASTYLSTITVGEILTSIRVEKLAIWHGLLYKYFSTRPSGALIHLKRDERIRILISENQLEFWKAALVFFSSSEKIKAYVEEMIQEFDLAFELFKLKHIDAESRNL